MGKNTLKEAMFQEKLESKRVRCNLCPHHCILRDGQTGICRVRINRNGKLYTMVYGMASSVAMDPIEKKPLFHFHPGSRVLSFSTLGCNMRCKHCQNYSISQADIRTSRLRKMAPDDIVRLAEEYEADGIAWTYNEPSIWYEFIYDASKIAKEAGYFVVMVTNGYIEEEPLRMLADRIDAMNIDVKAFTNEFYRKITGARLEPVLKTVKLAKELGIHIELTYLIIPTLNDREKEIREFCRWVAKEVGDKTPVHFSRFHPDYELTHLPKTPMETMDMAYDVAKEEGLKFPYLGNILPDDRENTYCPKCGKMLIGREYFNVGAHLVTNGKCRFCGEDINVIQ